MKIYYDPDEQGKLDCGKIPAVPSPGLEVMTGADFLVSPLAIPLTSITIKGHMKAGAVLVQQKRGHDYANSVFTPRLKASIAKMREYGHRVQCVIQYVGTWDISEKGGLLLDDKQTYGDFPMTPETWFSEQAKINGRGATFQHLQRSDQLEAWCYGYIKGIKDMLEHPSLDVYPPKVEKGLFMDDYLIQDVRLVPDSFAVMASFPYVGPQTVKKLFNYYGDHLGRWLEELTYPDPDESIFNKRQKEAGIRLMGLSPWERLGIIVDQAALIDHMEHEAKDST